MVGNAIATSPLLSQRLAGQVAPGRQRRAFFRTSGSTCSGQLHLLLQGSLNVDKSVTFGDLPTGLPDIPIAHFQLTFTDPPGLLIANRDLCVPPPPALPR